ncbi:hypothetical protein [Nocardioides sp. Leaf285]|uniref:hypothetical protein n=1 Tax=Nocardioides sp. Leaf285 TaxID=1736322 RepID=UPI0012EA5A9A|nr:hypothetical protein [Nocardioides sp. Leaf285]
MRPISIDNQAPQELSWDAHPHDQPYAEYLANGGWYKTLALDFDARGDNGRQKVESEVQLVKRLLRAVALGFIDCASGPTGGRHLVATFDGDGVSAAYMRLFCQRLKDLLDLSTLDIACMTNPETGCIRPPYSAHRLGGRSEPSTSLEVTPHTLARGNDPMRLRALLDAMDITRGPRLSTGPALHVAVSYGAEGVCYTIR